MSQTDQERHTDPTEWEWGKAYCSIVGHYCPNPPPAAPQPRSIFLAYSSENPIPDNMHRFQSRCPRLSATALSWETLRGTSSVIFCDVCAAMYSSEVTACEITDMNQNVLFEFGFALGKGRRTLLLRDVGSKEKRLQFLSDVREVRYENVDQIVSALGHSDPFQEPPLSASLLRSAIDADDPWSGRADRVRVLYVRGASRSEAAMSIQKSLDKAARHRKFDIRVDDPNEDFSHQLYYLYRLIHGSHIVIANLAPTPAKRRDEINARACLLSGIALALGKHVVMFQQTPADHLIDMQGILKEYANASQAEHLAKEALSLVSKVEESLSDTAARGASLARPRRALKRPIDRVAFGNAAAENESDQLAAYFLETPVYNAAINGSRTLFAGRRGSGKTATCLRHS